MIRSIVVIVAVILAAGVERPADACSLIGIHLPPTHVEMVAQTQAIVVARADKAIPAKGDTGEASSSDDFDDKLSFTIEAVIKAGGAHAGELVRGRTLVLSGTPRYAGPSSDPMDFSSARPGAYSGGCVAHDYGLGRKFLLFIRYDDQRWVTDGEPFTRVNEELSSDTDPWLAAIREYVRIARQPVLADRIAALHALEARGAAPSATATDRAIARDVHAHFATPSYAKSFAEIETIYRAHPADTNVLAALGARGDPEARAIMRSLLAELVAGTRSEPDAVRAVGMYFDRIADPTAVPSALALYAKLGPASDERSWLVHALVRGASDSQRAMMERAVGVANDRDAGMLAAWFVHHPSKIALDELQRRAAGKLGAEPKLALGLAALGDPAIVAWARGELAMARHENRWLSLDVIAYSPRSEADAAARAVIAAGGDDLVTLIQGYLDAEHANVMDRLKEISRSIWVTNDSQVREAYERVWRIKTHPEPSSPSAR